MRNWERMRLIVGMIAGGYAMLLADTALEHRALLRFVPLTWIPLATAALLALLVGITTLRWSGFWRRLAALAGFASMAVGGAGLWFHNAHRLLHAGSGTGPLTPPALAPGAFAGLGMMLLVAAWPQKQPRVQPAPAVVEEPLPQNT